MSVSGQLACGRLSNEKDGCRSCAESGTSNAEECATLQVCATLLLKEPVAKPPMSPHSFPRQIHSTCVRWRLLLRFLLRGAVDHLLLPIHSSTVSLRRVLLKLSFNMVRKNAVWAHVNRLAATALASTPPATARSATPARRAAVAAAATAAARPSGV